MYTLSRTIPVNEPGQPVLSRHDVWQGLVMKANNALPYVPAMKKCEVIEKGQGWLLRDILLGAEPLREKVTFEPERRVVFERVLGNEQGNLTLTFSFSLTRKGLEGNPEAEKKHFAPMEGMYFNAVASTLAAVRRMVAEKIA
jgi:Domain of unknown function (DUF1857)